MKRYLILMLLVVVASANVAIAQKSKNTKQKDYVEVLYFHGKQRCVTCRAIEANAKEVVEKDFAKELKQGKVRFKTVDISTETGEKMAEAYKVIWSSLFVNRWKNGKETRNDLTRMGFQNARNNSAVFKSRLKTAITESMK